MEKSVETSSNYRDHLLVDSSPIRNLLLSILFIGVLILVFFVSWVIYSRKNRSVIPLERYAHLEIGAPDEDIDAIKISLASQGVLPNPTDKANEVDTSKLNQCLPEAALVGLARSKEEYNQHLITAKKIDTTHSKLKVQAFSKFESIEKLIASHKRQCEQRDRFIDDPRNVGLRNMALVQIRMQQKSERQIMKLKGNIS
jgi:hypothetical protein